MKTVVSETCLANTRFGFASLVYLSHRAFPKRNDRLILDAHHFAMYMPLATNA